VITESESGRIVDQPIVVQDLRAAIPGDGTVTLVVVGEVPSACHEALVGFEEPDAAGVLVGSAESWLDPECESDGQPIGFGVGVTIPSLPDGDYVARLTGVDDLAFSLPNVGRVDGPVLISPHPESGVFEGMAAEVKGTIVLEAGCLLMELEGIRYPLVWPFGTTWQPDPPAVRLGGGVLVEAGMDVYGGGGYLDRTAIEAIAGSEVAAAAAECAGPTGEIALFNLGSDVILVEG
jgi:hypothetical protein